MTTTLNAPAHTQKRIDRQRLGILAKLEHWLELPMAILGGIWLVLLVIDFATGWGETLQPISNAIWIIFIVDFAIRLTIAPNKRAYLLRNWLTGLALLLPALRVFQFTRALRVFRFARAAKGRRLLRVVTSVNRGMNSFGRVMHKRGLAYVLLVTIMVVLAASAGMYAFEKNSGMTSYGMALWWTAMMVTTMGSEYWPKTTEGRLLCFLIALYAFSVFGYVTAALASFFVDRDSADGSALEKELRQELAAIRAELHAVSGSSGNGAPHRTKVEQRI